MLQDNRRTRTWLTRSDCHCRWIKAFLLQENTSLCTAGMIMESVLHKCVTAGSLCLPSRLLMLNLNAHNTYVRLV